MALPPQIQLVTVSFGPFLDFQGQPLAGSTRFEPSTPVNHAATGTPILNRPITVQWDEDGRGLIVLPATDSIGLDVTGFTYRVRHQFVDGNVPAPPSYSIQLPAAAPTVDLDLLIPVPAQNGVVVSVPGVVSVAGLTGTVTGDQLAALPELRAAFDAWGGGGGSGQPFVLPGASGGDDRAAIQAVLDAARSGGGGWVLGRSGAQYQISDALVVASGTTLDMRGCSVTGSSSKNLVRNAATIPARTVTDAVTTASSTTITSTTAAFTSADVGRAVQVLGAGPNAGNSSAPGSLYATVVSVTNATTIVLSRPAQSSRTGATLNVFPARDSDIAILGGRWFGGERFAASQTLAGHMFFLRRVDRLIVAPERMVSTRSDGDGGGGGYAISVGDVTQVQHHSTTYDVGSDGFHVQGPAQGIDVHNVSGRTGDDLVAFTGVDGQTQNGSLLGDVEGDITDVTVDTLTPRNAWTALKITSGTGTGGVVRRVARFHAGRITGSTQRGAVNIVDYAGVTSFDGTIADVNVLVGSGRAQVTIDAAQARTVRLDGVTWDSSLAAPDAGVVAVNSPVADLRIRNLTVAGSATGTGIGVRLAAVVNRLSVLGVAVPDAPTTLHLLSVPTAGLTFPHVTLSQIARTGGGDLVNVSAANVVFGELLVAEGYQNSGAVLAMSADSTGKSTVRISSWRQLAGGLVTARAPMDVVLSGVRAAVTATAAVQAASDAASPLRVLGSSVSIESGVLLSRSGTQDVSVSGASCKADLSILTPRAGDLLYNSNTAHAVGAGPVTTDRTTLKNLVTGASAAAPTPGVTTPVTGGIGVGATATLKADDFERADTTGGGTVGNGWADPASVFYVSSGTAKTTGTSTTTAAWYWLINSTAATNGMRVGAELITAARSTNTTPNYPLPVVAVDSATAPTSGYGARYNMTAGAWTLVRWSGGADTTVATASASAAPALPVDHEVRFDPTTGVVELWLTGSSSPLLTYTDPSPLTGRYFGLAMRSGGTSASAATQAQQQSVGAITVRAY